MEKLKAQKIERFCKPLSKTEKRVRVALWAIFEAFTGGTLVYILIKKIFSQVLICIGTMLLLLVPFIASKLLHFEMNTVFFGYCLFYAIGPMCGYVYNLYYITSWWDDLLHLSGGIVFAIFGVYLIEMLNGKGEMSLFVKLLFALVFSIALSALWENWEFSSDRLLHTDMQKDRVVSEIHSYLLGDNVAEMGTLDGINEVIVDGKSLGLDGYLDIGLYDTMSDMIIETLGAVSVVVYYILDKERHPLMYKQVAA